MTNKKLLSAVLTLSLLIGGVITAHAATVASSSIYLLPTNGSAHSVDSYVTAPAAGSIREQHRVTGGKYPSGSFLANMELKTAWYTPNVVKDHTPYPNGENNGTFTKGQELRTVMYVSNTYAASGYDLEYTR